MFEKVQVSEQDQKEICDLYTQQGWTIKLLTEKYNLSRFVISKVLTKNGIQTKRHTKRSGLFVREDQLETVDTEQKSYFV